MQNELLEQFVDKMIAEKKMDLLEPAVLAEVKQDLLRMAEDKINSYIIEALPKDKIDDFTEVLEGNDPEEIQTFLRDVLDDLDEIVARALIDFRRAYIG